jgi:predicted dehydrogenase
MKETSMKPVRMLIIGCGSWRGAWFTGEFHSHPAYEVVGLVNTRVKVAQAVSDFLGLGPVPIHTDWNEAIEKVDFDAALVIYPDFLHKPIMLDLLQAGKYVYLEKPMTTNLPDCLEIIRADRAAGGKTMVGFNARYMPLYENLHRLVQEGYVGDVLTLQSDEFYYNGRTLMRRWNRLREMGGGLWVTKACHDLDLQFWMAGALPKTVSSTTQLTYYKPKPEAAEFCRDCKIEQDCPDSHLKFRGDGDYHDFPPLRRVIEDAREDTGKRADICLFNSQKDTFDHGQVLTAFENGAMCAHTLNIVVPFTDRRMRISGTEGTLDGSSESPEYLYWRRHDGEDYHRAQRIPIADDPRMIQGGHGGADNRILNQFLGFVRGTNTSVTRPAEASIAVATGVAATIASDTNKTVILDEMEGWTELKGYLAEENIPPVKAAVK